MILNKRLKVTKQSFVLILSLFFELSSYWKNIRADDNIDYIPSVCGLEALLETERVLLFELESYVDTLTVHLQDLQSEIDAIKGEHFVASENPQGFLTNPVNAFRLIKRLHNEWGAFEEKIKKENCKTTYVEAMSLHRQAMNFPSQADVFGAASALVRLQDTYTHNASDVSNGILNGNKYGIEMTWLDCFQLSHILYELKDFPHTIAWLELSVNKLFSSSNYDDSYILDVLEAVVQYFYEMAYFDRSLELVNYILATDYDRQHLVDLKSELEHLVEVSELDIEVSNMVEQSRDYHQTNEYKLYEMICREEVSLAKSQSKNLHCQYFNNNIAYRLLQPFKMEIHFHDPFIVQFHDILNIDEMEQIKFLATPKMSRSMVQAHHGINTTISPSRTSKTTWFSYDADKVLDKLRIELEHASGLNTKYAEELQVANYGLAGHFEPHWDFFTNDDSFDPQDGNRLATGIFYLSNVEEGGSTAFPFLNVLIKPQQGSLVFWYNLHSSEERDYRTKHAACPVLKGSKWIANIWVRVRGQERERPCSLEPEKVHVLYRDYD